MANIQFQLRRGLSSLWTSVNPILSSGEMGVETDTNKIKIGNGLSGWTSLLYSAGDTASIGPYVTTFNGLTGAVTGVTVGGTNVFTALNTFNAGICASGGITFANDISVNSIIVGKGAGGITYSVALGNGTLILNTTGDYNVGIGSDVLSVNLTGSENVGLGSFALHDNTNSNNTGIGSNSLFHNTTGTDNVGVGSMSLLANTTGSRNVAIGRSSLSLNGDDNVSIGAYSLSNFAPSVFRCYNTAIGSQAGRYRTGGLNLQGATGCIYIGYGAKGSANAQTNEIVIGTLAEALGSNTAVIGATTQTSATIYGLMNLPSGLSASGATFSNTVNVNSNTLYKPTLQYYNEPTLSPGISGNTLSLDLSLAQVFNVSLNAGISSFIVTNVPQTASRAIGFSLFLTADGTARGISWGSTVKWPSGIPPTLTTTNNKTDILSFTTLDGGTSYFGSVAGQNY